MKKKRKLNFWKRTCCRWKREMYWRVWRVPEYCFRCTSGWTYPDPTAIPKKKEKSTITKPKRKKKEKRKKKKDKRKKRKKKKKEKEKEDSIRKE